MIPFFKKLEITDNSNPVDEIVRHINAMQDEIRECFENITSENVTELNMDITKITSQRGSSISGDLIKLIGAGGETLTAGYDKDTGVFELSVKDKDGNIV